MSVLLNRRLDWKADRKDHRDLIFQKNFALRRSLTLPSVVDLRDYMSSIEDQGHLGSCTAHAIAGCLEFLQGKEQRDGQQEAPQEFSKYFRRFSRLFIYYNERKIEGDVGGDNGAELRDGVKSLAKWGCCDEHVWPYKWDAITIQPPSGCYEQATNHKISQYYRLTTLEDMKTCLANGYPFVFGIYVYDSFMSEEVARWGNVPVPGPSENIQGGHAICAVGYNDEKQGLLVRNSWGVGWGIGGYFWLPYEYATNPQLATDFWTIRK